MEEELSIDDHTRSSSTRKLGRKLKISRGSAHNLLKKAGYRPWKDQKRQFLSEAAKKKRCKDNGHQNILFSDEKLLTIEQAYNHHNDMIWSGPSSSPRSPSASASG
jgi:hypothetical protein